MVFWLIDILILVRIFKKMDIRQVLQSQAKGSFLAIYKVNSTFISHLQGKLEWTLKQWCIQQIGNS